MSMAASRSGRFGARPCAPPWRRGVGSLAARAQLRWSFGGSWLRVAGPSAPTPLPCPSIVRSASQPEPSPVQPRLAFGQSAASCRRFRGGSWRQRAGSRCGTAGTWKNGRPVSVGIVSTPSAIRKVISTAQQRHLMHVGHDSTPAKELPELSAVRSCWAGQRPGPQPVDSCLDQAFTQRPRKHWAS